MRKPDGLVVVLPGTEAAFLAPLPVRRLWGVGPKMEEVLLKIGVRTIGELATCNPARLERRLGTHVATTSSSLALGIRPTREKSVSEGEGRSAASGQEHTFGADTGDRERLRTTRWELCDAVARRLRQHAVRARTVTLKYRDEDFHTSTRAKTLPAAVDSGDAIAVRGGLAALPGCPRPEEGAPRRSVRVRPGRRRRWGCSRPRLRPGPTSRGTWSSNASARARSRARACSRGRPCVRPGDRREETGNAKGERSRTGKAARGCAGKTRSPDGAARYFLGGGLPFLRPLPAMARFTLALPRLAATFFLAEPRLLAAPRFLAERFLAEARGLDGRRRAAGLGLPPGSALTAFLARPAIVPAGYWSTPPSPRCSPPSRRQTLDRVEYAALVVFGHHPSSKAHPFTTNVAPGTERRAWYPSF